jgi:hypothetical protein
VGQDSWDRATGTEHITHAYMHNIMGTASDIGRIAELGMDIVKSKFSGVQC